MNLEIAGWFLFGVVMGIGCVLVGVFIAAVRGGK